MEKRILVILTICFYRFNYVPLFRVKSVPPNGA
jgi:hypothetical protein